MARVARVVLPEVPVHLIQRGHNRAQIFFTSKDALLFLQWLEEAAILHGVAVHAYVLMTNHVHLLATPQHSHSLARLTRSVGTRYAMHINAAHQRTGALWEGRYRTSIIDAERYFLICSRYIELNPVRAGLAATPEAYRWSSFRSNVGERSDSLVSPHPIYQSLGKDRTERSQSYRALFDQALPAPTLEEIRTAINGCRVLGQEKFIDALETETGYPIKPARPGRPRVWTRISEAEPLSG